MKHLNSRTPLFLAMLATTPVSLAATSTEQSATEEVVVTADFRQTDVQSIPEATSVIGNATIEQRSADHLESILALAPNVNFASGASRGRYFQIRGIGERSQFVSPVNPSVGLRIDGIDMTGLGGAATLFDVNQVEVLRGPQGTRFGANALAGMINIDSHAPTQTTQGYVSARLGNYNSREAGAAISGALNEQLTGRLALEKNTSDGYIHNLYLDRDDTNNIDEAMLRGRLSYTPDARNQLDLTLLRVNVNNGYDAFSLDNNRNTYSNHPGQDEQQTSAGSLAWTSERASGTRFELHTSASNSDTAYGYDEDWAYGEYTWMDDSVTYTPDPCDTTQGPCLAEADGYSSTDLYVRQHQRRDLDVRLLSGDDQRLFNNSTDWVVGAYSMTRHEDLTRIYTYLDSNFISALDTRAVAVYGELTTAINDNTRVMYGVRGERWSTDYHDSNRIANERSENLWGGKVTLEHLYSDTHLLYASMARGYKAGGVNTDPDIAESNRTFDTEFNNAFETGLKSGLLDDTLRTRVAAFYILRKNQQVLSSYAIQNTDNSVTFQDYLANAAEGHNYGLELESDWDLNEQLNWAFSYGYLVTEFLDYQYQTDAGQFSKNGRAQAQAPRYSLASSLQYSLGNGVSLGLETEAKDQFYFSDSHNEQSTAYVLWHARLAYEIDDWQLALYGRNLSNVDYAVRGFGGFGNDPRNGYAENAYVQYGEPRVLGLEGKYFF